MSLSIKNWFFRSLHSHPKLVTRVPLKALHLTGDALLLAVSINKVARFDFNGDLILGLSEEGFFTRVEHRTHAE